MKEPQYYSHLCACGCGGKIEIKRHHKWKGFNIPNYITGHNNKGRVKNYCSVEQCNNLSVAFDLCNAHYIRYKKGKNLIPKIQERQKGRFCKKAGCDKLSGKKGGYGFCKKHYTKFRRKERLKYLIKLLGGKCSRCSIEFPIVVYDFHHIDPKMKKFTIGDGINNYSMEILIEEAKKCELLCSNCHRLITFGDSYE